MICKAWSSMACVFCRAVAYNDRMSEAIWLTPWAWLVEADGQPKAATLGRWVEMSARALMPSQRWPGHDAARRPGALLVQIAAQRIRHAHIPRHLEIPGCTFRETGSLGIAGAIAVIRDRSSLTPLLGYQAIG